MQIADCSTAQNQSNLTAQIHLRIRSHQSQINFAIVSDRDWSWRCCRRILDKGLTQSAVNNSNDQDWIDPTILGQERICIIQDQEPASVSNRIYCHLSDTLECFGGGFSLECHSLEHSDSLNEKSPSQTVECGQARLVCQMRQHFFDCCRVARVIQ